MAGARFNVRDLAGKPTAVVKVDAREVLGFSRELQRMAGDQFPFALAAGLTDTARTARDETRDRLPQFFTVRNRGLVRAIGYKPASKRDKPPEALVHTEQWAEFLTLQATGGTKRAKSGRVAIPTRIVKRTASGRVPKRFLPRPLRQRRGLQESEVPAGRIRVRGVRSVPKGLSLFYHLRRSVQIRKRWPFEGEVRRVVARDVTANVRRRLEQALATRRPG